MNIRDVYSEVKKRIDKVDFNSLWPGFKKLRFAIYNEKEACFDGDLIDKHAEFIANTAILYKEEEIGIWNLTEETDCDVLSSKLIHEMFHGFQCLNNESRFPDEFEAIIKYKYIDENLSIKLIENKIISSLAMKFDTIEYQKLLLLRKYRSDKYPYEYDYEVRIEEIEGTANYVEFESLKQINYEKYSKKFAQSLKDISNKDYFIPIRIISYDIGALLFKVIIENHINVDLSFSNILTMKKILKGTESIKQEVALEFRDDINQYFVETDEIIKKALKENEVVFFGSEELAGFNVYNARYLDGYLVSNYFIAYGKGDAKTLLYGDFVAKTDGKNISKIYKTELDY